jgi:hypothetical protein
MSYSSMLPPDRQPEAIYPYRDETGTLLFEVFRWPGKNFGTYQPDGKGGWLAGPGDARRVLYRLPALLAAPNDQPVFLVEGEKDADNLTDLGLIATTSPFGANAWQSAYADSLRGKQVVILPDKDDAGEKYAANAVKDIQGVAASVKLLRLPGLPKGGDVSIWLEADGTKEQLLALVEAAPPYSPESPPPDAKGEKEDNSALQRVLGKLKNVTEAAGGWLASCPVPTHGRRRGDLRPSLSVAVGDGEKVLCNCFAGCPTQAVVAALGLRMADLFPPISAETSLEDALVILNSKHAVVDRGGKTMVLTEASDPEGRTIRIYSTFQSFKDRYSNKLMKKGQTLSDWWLTHPARRQYEGVVFAPNQETPGYYNVWRGFAVQPKPGDCSKFWQHVFDNICNGDPKRYQWLLAWMAQAVQQPEKRPGTALVLRGKQGTGKGVFAKAFGRLFDPHFKHVSNPRHFLGNFNAHLEDALLVFVDEGFWAGDKTMEGPLKALVTEDILILERKGVDATQARNYMRVIVASNEDWVVPAGPEERRFAVFDVGDARMQDHAYFNAIEDELDNGGREALLDYLLNLNLAKYPNPAVIPKTAALLDQKLASLNPVEAWLYGRLQWGSQTRYLEGLLSSEATTWEPWVKTKRLYGDFQATDGLGGKQKHVDEASFVKALKKLVPGLTHQRRRQDEGQSSGYVFPSLADCRKAFEKHVGQKVDWPDDAKEEETEGVPVGVEQGEQGEQGRASPPNSENLQ